MPLKLKIGVVNGFLVYTVVVEYDDGLNKVIVDAGDGRGTICRMSVSGSDILREHSMELSALQSALTGSKEVIMPLNGTS